MFKTNLLAVGLVAAAASVASAGGQAGSVGAGAESQISGLGGASVTFDAGDFHVGGFMSFHDPGGDDDDTLAVGGRFFFHIHSTAMSDFGIGGTLGIASENQPSPDDRQTFMYVEPSFQIRAFVTSNVALSFNGGITIGVMDAENVDVGGQLVGGSGAFIISPLGAAGAFSGGAGVHYYFF